MSGLTDVARIERLQPPDGPVRLVLDTDTYNEIDDQFALAYALLSPEAVRLEAGCAAPFHNNRSTGPADGMEKSYEEIHRVLERMGRTGEVDVLRRSPSYLPAPDEPVVSPAAEDLVRRALATEGEPLYVAATGAITNVASAILMDERIRERIVVIWLGGHPVTWHTAREFNLQQDVRAARVVLDSGVPLVQIPCKNVAEHLRTTIPELEGCLGGVGGIAEYLLDITRSYTSDPFAWSKVIWDISAIAWLIDADWVPTVLAPSPILTDQVTWSHDPRRHLIRQAVDCHRDAIFRDLFTKLAGRRD